jgi:hypothetical protein
MKAMILTSMFAVIVLTGCGTTAPKLTKQDLVYFPEYTINLVNSDECLEAVRRLDKFPKEYNRNDGFTYWLDAKTQRAYTMGYFNCYSGRKEYSIKVVSFKEIAERNYAKRSAEGSKKSMIESRVDRLGI